MKSSEKTMEVTMTLTTVVQIVKLVQCDIRGAAGVISMSMAPFTEGSRSLRMLLLCSAKVKEHLQHKSAYFTVKTGLTQAYCRPKRNDKIFSLC